MILEQESPPQPQVLPLWPLKVDGTGYVARNDEEPQCLHSPVLLIANTRLPNSDRLPDDIVPAIMQILPGARIRVTVRRYSKPPLVQVRALLESLQFPRDVEALDAIVKELETMGTFVSWQQTVREFGT